MPILVIWPIVPIEVDAGLYRWASGALGSSICDFLPSHEEFFDSSSEGMWRNTLDKPGGRLCKPPREEDR
jgi:hypothetical protein